MDASSPASPAARRRTRASSNGTHANGNGKPAAANGEGAAGPGGPHAVASPPNRGSESWGPWACMLLLALQYGFQPFVTARFTSPAAIKTVTVLMCELIKVTFSIAALLLSRGGLAGAFRGWAPWAAASAVVPCAASYSLQNILVQMAYQHLDSVTFNCLNQTKIAATAVAAYLLLGVRQSRPQMLGLAMLLAAAVALSLSPEPLTPESVTPESRIPESGIHESGIRAASYPLGLAAVLAASALSGLGSSLSQRATQRLGRGALLFQLENSAASAGLLLSSLLFSPDGRRVMREGVFAGWAWTAWLPVFMHAAGGVLVNAVTSQLSGVHKGFAVVGGLLVTGVTQSLLGGAPLPPRLLGGLGLVAAATLIHARNPPRPGGGRAREKAG